MTANVTSTPEQSSFSGKVAPLGAVSTTQSELSESTRGQRTKRQQVEDYLRFRFNFRYNVVTGRIEFKGRAKETFEPLEDYALNSIVRSIDNDLGIFLAPDRLKKMLISDFVPKYDPITDYLHSLRDCVLPGSSAIAALAATVETERPDVFLLSLTKWLVATVANALTPDGCQNQTCLVLTGTQGAFKTTWLNNLCPASLNRYRFTGKISLDNKDTLALLPSMFIINLDDQLRNLNKNDAESVKTLISQGNVIYRAPYAELVSEHPRRASFVGSVNGNDFLTDPTGSRRFLPFEVSGIDINTAQALNMNDVWAEAVNLYVNEYRYWFTAQETAEYFDNNEAFQVHTPEYELLLEHYEPVKEREAATHHLTTSAILAHLENFTKSRLRTKQLGEALTKAGFFKFSKREKGRNPLNVWAVRERSSKEIEKERRYETGA